MSLSAAELEAVVAELAPLVGWRVDAVRVHAERALTLELHGRERADAALLLVSAEPEVTRLHVARQRPPAPDAPIGWQGLLRKELPGARLAGLDLALGDRVVRLTFERAAGRIALVAELTGRHGNLVLVGEDGVVRALASRHQASRRELAPGQPYRSPTDGRGEPPPPGAEPTPRRLVAPDRFAVEAGTGDPDREGRAGERTFPRSAEVERLYLELEAARLLAEARRRLREPLRAAAARLERALLKLADEAARVPAAEGDRRLGDLLKTNLHAVRRGATEVTLTEWTAEGPEPVKVALDPAQGPRENMERYYRRFRRITESAARVTARQAEVSATLAALRALLARLEAAPGEALPAIEREARRLGAAPRAAAKARHKRDAPLPPYRSYRSAAGVSLLVGRGAAENDELTRRVARGNDLWLHARGVTGAHVVARLGGRPPDQETLLDAAHLAAHFSDARGELLIEIAATRVKYVKKPKGAAPGAVTYTQEKMIQLRVEPARVARLLAEAEDGEA